MDNERICNNCRHTFPLTEFVTETKSYKCCNMCREIAKKKYTPKPPEQRVKREKNQKRDPPTDSDTEYFCRKCHTTLPINCFKSECKFFKTCEDCRVEQKESYCSKKSSPKPKTKVHCEVCNKDICSHLYQYHLNSATHKYQLQRKTDLPRRRKMIKNKSS